MERIFISLFGHASRKFFLQSAFCFERKMESEIKLNSEYLFKLAILEINTNWRMNIFSDTT